MAIDERMEGIEAVFLDLDGTIYLGGELIEGASEFLDRLDQRGVKRFFFTDSEMIVVPYRNEDRGYTKTVVQQSVDMDEEKEKTQSSQLQTSTTTTHAGKVREGNRVEYTQSKVGIMLKMTDKNSGEIVWSNSYWYSGLELQRTIDLCIRNSVLQIKKLFQ